MAKIFWKMKSGELVLVKILDIHDLSSLSLLSLEELRKIVIKFD